MATSKNTAIPEDTFTPTTHGRANGKSILILTADKTQDLEFFYPFYRFNEEGYKVDVATPKGGELKCELGMGIKNTLALDSVNAEDYCLLYIPGGKAPEELKKNPKAIALAKAFAKSNKPIAAICHGPQLLAAADLIKGHTIAAWPEVEKEVQDAGATYANEPTVVDGQFITARMPADLPSHLAHTLQRLRDDQLGTGTPISVLRAAQA